MASPFGSLIGGVLTDAAARAGAAWVQDKWFGGPDWRGTIPPRAPIGGGSPRTGGIIGAPVIIPPGTFPGSVGPSGGPGPITSIFGPTLPEMVGGVIDWVTDITNPPIPQILIDRDQAAGTAPLATTTGTMEKPADPRYGCWRMNAAGQWVRVKRRRRRLITQSDIKDLAALKAILSPGEFKLIAAQIVRGR